MIILDTNYSHLLHEPNQMLYYHCNKKCTADILVRNRKEDNNL